MNRSEKREAVTHLSDSLKNSSLVVVTQPKGLTVEESSALRSRMREGQASFHVVKNSLARIAAKEQGFEEISSSFKGPVALAFSKDPVSAAKVAVSYAEENPKLTVLSGLLDGKFLDATSIKALAKLPSLEELRAKILGVIMAPASKLARTIKEPSAQVVRVVSSYSKK